MSLNKIAAAPAMLSRPLSPLEKVLWKLSQTNALNVTVAGAVAGPLAESSLLAGLRRLQQHHPLLQVRLVERDNAVQFDSADTPEPPLRFLDAPAEQCPSIIEDEINTPFDEEQGPLARCVWVRHDENSHHLAITFHHVIADGMSGALMLRDLLRLSALADDPPEESRLTDSAPMDYRLPPAACGWRGAWNQARFVAKTAWDDIRLRPPARPREDEPSPLNTRRTRLLCRTLDQNTVDALAQKASQEQTSVHGALGAAICLGLAEDNASPQGMSFKFRTPVNVRESLDPPPGESVGMFASMAFYRGRVKASDSFWPLARNIRANIKQQVSQGLPSVLTALLPRVYQHVGGDRLSAEAFGDHWRKRTGSTAGLTNLGRITWPGEIGPYQLQSLYFAAAPGGLGDYACTATTYNGVLRWNFLFASPYFQEERALQITERTIEKLEQALVE